MNMQSNALSDGIASANPKQIQSFKSKKPLCGIRRCERWRQIVGFAAQDNNDVSAL